MARRWRVSGSLVTAASGRTASRRFWRYHSYPDGFHMTRRSIVLIVLFRSGTALLAFCALISGISCGGAQTPRQGKPLHAILIMLDAARPDRFSSYGYDRQTTPAMDALASRGVIFRNHYAQGAHTREALPPLLYSRYYTGPLFPGSDRVPYSAPEDLFRAQDGESTSMPAVLSGAGFRTVMISAHTWLKPSTTFAREFDEIHDLSAAMPQDSELKYPDARVMIDFAQSWMEEHEKEDYFIYLHLMDTHFPHLLGDEASSFLPEELRANPPVERFSHFGKPLSRRQALTGDDRLYLDALYDGSLLKTDRELERLFKGLGDGLDDTLIMITSDHGEHLLELPGRFSHGRPWLELVARVPLIISYPSRLAGGQEVFFTESVDLLPTMLSLLDVSVPEGKRFDGVDLTRFVGSDRPPRQAVVMRKAIRDERYKALFKTSDFELLEKSTDDWDRVKGRLFDLVEDPDETIDLWSQRPEVARQMLKQYRTLMTKPYKRFMASTTQIQPTSAFAISSKHFIQTPLGRSTARLSEVEEFVNSDNGWLRIIDSTHFMLMASGKAPELTLEFTIPDGRYRLSLLMRGRASLKVGSGQDAFREITAKPFNGNEYFPWEMDYVDFGEVNINGKKFQATIQPEDPASPLIIGSFGFKPVGIGEELDPDDEKETLERLRGLGYID
jgi:arylsulfatase